MLDDNPRLGPLAREAVAAATAVHVSVATVWELTIKAMLGELTIPEKFAGQLHEQGLILLNIDAAHAEGIREFPELVRHDPFDRLIVAQAKQSGLDLITADRVLLALGQSFIIDATA